MTAGRGIIHAEMPGKSIDGSPNVGLQLWVDLPKHLKFCEPRYRDLRAEEIPTVKADSGKVEVKIISGTSHGVDSIRDLAYTPVWILDVTIKAGGKLSQSLPNGWNAFVYTLSGNAVFSGKRVGEFHSIVFGAEGDGLEVEVEEGEKGDARFGVSPPTRILLREPFFANNTGGISDYCWPAARPTGNPVRTICTQHQRAGLRSFARLPKQQ